MENANLFWFGFVIELGFILLILKLVALNAKDADQLDTKHDRLHRDDGFDQERSSTAKLQQELRQQNEQLTQQCLHLQQELQTQASRLSCELQQSTFKQLQTLLINYPSASKIAQVNPSLPAKNLTAMLTPLDNLIANWGYQVIGPVWEQVAYDPKLHQADAPDLQPGEPVYIRYVGYREGETILCPAKVSRTLPGTAKETTVHQASHPVS